MTTAQTDYQALLALGGIAYSPIALQRQRAFSEVWTIVGVNLTTATFSGAVRTRPDAPGSALATITISAALVGTDTVLTLSIAEAAVTALPVSSEPGTAALFYFDVTCTPSGGVRETIVAGEAFVSGSIVQ